MIEPIITHVGRADVDDYEHFGLRVFRDLAGSTSYLGLIAFSISGRRLSREDEAVLDDVASCSHVTEPRVWPIKLTRVVASLGRAVPAYIAGIVALDSDLLGGRVSGEATSLLVDLAEAVEKDDSDDAVRRFVATRERMTGFGVPVRAFDERLVALRNALVKRGRTQGRYWQLAERFWRIVKEMKGVEPNIIGAASAVCLDLGFDATEASALAVVLLQPTFLSNAVEGAAQQSSVLQRLPDEAVRYVGVAPRVSPRARNAAERER